MNEPGYRIVLQDRNDMNSFTPVDESGRLGIPGVRPHTATPEAIDRLEEMILNELQRRQRLFGGAAHRLVGKSGGHGG